MRSENEHKENIERGAYRELQVLSAVDDDPKVSQRELSQRVGIALGLTNVLMRNLVQKGYVRISKASWKRRLYTLTPEGFTHRVRLMTGYIQNVLDHYQNVRETLRVELDTLALNEESRVAILGTGQFAELVYLGLKEFSIEEIDIFSDGTLFDSRFLGLPVRDITALRPEDYDRVMIASIGEPGPMGVELLQRLQGEEKLVSFFKKSKPRRSGR